MADLIEPLLVTPGSTVKLSRDHDPGYTGHVSRQQAAKVRTSRTKDARALAAGKAGEQRLPVHGAARVRQGSLQGKECP